MVRGRRVHRAHPTWQTRAMSAMECPSTFFAYASRPPACAEAMATAAKEIEQAGMQGVLWECLNPGGRVLIEEITSAIDSSSCVVAEVSSMNQNVLFEAGYALAKNKQMFLALDESLDTARRLWDGVQLFSTIGRLDYQGNGHTLANLIIASSSASHPSSSLLTTILSDARPQQANALFAPTVPVRFQAADVLDRELNNRGSIQVLGSGDDLGLAPLTYYAGEIFRSSGAIFHLMNPDRRGAREHNARSSFLAGFAHGWERPLLMLAESEFAAPIDYRDLLFCYPTAAKMTKHVDDWLASLTLKPGSSRRLGRLAMELDLPVSSFGQYVAENEDSSLEKYFLPTREFTSVVDGESSVFVGRKGTGKTATMLQASSDLEKDRRHLVVKVKPTSYELGGLVDLVSRFQAQSGTEYLLNNLWIFLLSTEVACQLLARAQLQAAGLGGSEALAALARRLELMGVDPEVDLATRLEDKVEQIVASPAPLHGDRELKDVVGTALSVHWFKQLHAEIREAAAGRYTRIAVLVDNLDKTWERGADFGTTSRFLLALLSAAGQFRKTLLRGSELTLTLAVFIRSDIYEVMTRYAREPDKIGPVSVHWSDPHLLVRVLEERYAANRRRRNTAAADMWTTIFPEEVMGLRTRDYILWRILPRPRDIIYFGNAALTTAINRHHSIITQDDISMADEAYSRFAYEALLVESDAQGFDLEELLFGFAGRPSTLTQGQLAEILAESSGDQTETRSWLLRTSFLGIELRPGKFVHVEGQIEVEKKLLVARRSSEVSGSEFKYRVHPAFRRFLDVRDDDLHRPGVEDITLGGDEVR